MFSVHVVTPNLTPGDAVSQDAAGMVHALRRHGHTAHLYASDIAPELRSVAEPVARYEALWGGRAEDILIYHHCIAWRRGVDLYARTRSRRVLKYHNVTPPTFYEGIHPDYVASCALGVAQTRELTQIPADLYLGDSEYNVEELIALGVPLARARVAPPFHQATALRHVPGDHGTLKYAEDGLHNILFVGRVAPNKGHLDLIAAFAHYHRYLNPRSRLFLVGDLDPRLEAYVSRVREAIDCAGLGQFVFLTGKVTSAQLKAYYLVAHAFLCASHHEGFCVPLVEAMAFKVPCVAVANTAIATTLGRAALTWEEFDAALLAESLHACQEDREVSDHVVDYQYSRYRRLYSPAAIGQRFLRCLRPLLGRVAA
jgi:glycosyltransferase involved in cell wall biosynthesis